MTWQKVWRRGADRGCLAKESVAAVIYPGSSCVDSSGGKPLGLCRGAGRLRVLLEGKVLDQARRMGEYLAKGLADCKERHRIVKDVRGLVLQGMELDMDAKVVVSECLARGLLINGAASMYCGSCRP